MLIGAKTPLFRIFVSRRFQSCGVSKAAKTQNRIVRTVFRDFGGMVWDTIGKSSAAHTLKTINQTLNPKPPNQTLNRLA